MAVLATFAALASLTLAAPAGVQAHSGHDERHFDDTEGSVHADALEALAEQGWLNGTFCGERSVCPQEPLLRWEMAVWVVRALTGSDPEPLCLDAWSDELGALPATTTLPAWNDPVWTDPTWGWRTGVGGQGAYCLWRAPLAGVDAFNDLTLNEWWIGHVGLFFDLGVTVGCEQHPDGKASYCPHQSVTRAQMATFLTRAFKLPAADPFGFADTEGAHHAASIDSIAAAGITVGCSQEPLRYCPDEPVNRGQMATFLARRFDLIPDQGASTSTTSTTIPAAATTAPPGQTRTPPGWARGIYPSGDVRIPVYFCAPPGAYTEEQARRITAAANRNVSDFYRRESSGRLTLTLAYAGIVSPGIDWNAPLTRVWGDISVLTSCEALAVAANSGERQLLVLTHKRSGGGPLGWARTLSGPAEAVLLADSGRSIRESTLHLVIAHELGHSLFGWDHPDEAGGVVRCADIEGSVMHSGSADADCPSYGDDPLSHFRVICEMRTLVGWPCGTQTVEPAAGDTPRSYGNWSAHRLAADVQLVTVNGIGGGGARLYVQCSPPPGRLDLRVLDVIVWWPGGNGARGDAQISVTFSPSGTNTSQPSVRSLSGQASYIGAFRRDGEWDNTAAKLTADSLIANDGNTATFTAVGHQGGTVTAVFDTRGARVSVRSLMNHCDAGG